MTKEQISEEMKTKYNVSDEKMEEYMKPMDINENVCSIDDNECLECGS